MLHLAALDTTNARQQASSLILDGCFWSLPSSFFSPANLTGPHAHSVRLPLLFLGLPSSPQWLTLTPSAGRIL
jgi:hypothetical protein